MASGDSLWVLYPQSSIPTVTLFATLDTVVDASTPVHAHLVLDFDGGTADEHADWEETIPSHYDGGGFTWFFKYAMDGTDAQVVQFEFRMIDLAIADVLTADLGIDTQTASEVVDTPSGTANAVLDSPTGALSHANAGSPAVGTRVIIRLTRDFDHEANTDDLQLLSIDVTET